MADHGAPVDGHIQGPEIVVEDLVQRQGAKTLTRGAVGEVAQHHGRQAVQRTTQLQRRQHAVDAVDVLVDLLQEQHRAVEGGQVARACQRAQHREVASHQPAAGPAGPQGADAVFARHRELTLVGRVAQQHGLGLAQHPHEVAHAEGIPFGCPDRCMESHQSSACMHRIDQCGGVAETGQHLGVAADVVVVEQRQDAVGARAAGERQQGIHARVGKQAVDVGRTLGVGAGKLAAAGPQVGPFTHLEAQGSEGVDGQFAGVVFVDRVGGVDQRDGGSRPQPRWLDQRHGAARRLRGDLGLHRRGAKPEGCAQQGRPGAAGGLFQPRTAVGFSRHGAAPGAPHGGRPGQSATTRC